LKSNFSGADVVVAGTGVEMISSAARAIENAIILMVHCSQIGWLYSSKKERTVQMVPPEI
jgi:hypothetical protein